ncbi:MAG: carboxypeptidase regulatory-like domain-containing protein [Dysgonomonas sp.]
MKKNLNRFLLVLAIIGLSLPILSWATSEKTTIFGTTFPAIEQGGEEKVAIQQNKAGNALDIPFYENWEDTATWKQWTTLDHNLDGVSWSNQDYEGYDASRCAFYRYGTLDADDWLFSPALNLKADKEYSITFWTNNIYVNQKMKVTFGTSKDPASQTSVILDLTSIDGTNRESTAKFRAPADGEYYIGFYAYSPGGSYSYLYLDNIKIEEAAQLGVPEKVGSLTQIPGVNGQISMGLSWINPSTTYGGSALSSISAIHIYKDGATTPVVYTSDLTKGKKITWTDPLPTTGSHTYRVTAVNSIGESYSEILDTYVGIDVPKGPENITLTADGKHGVLSWTVPPAFGVKGGWYDASDISYRIVRNPGNVVLEKEFKGTSYTDTSIISKANYSYTLTSKNPAGIGGASVSNNLIIGSSVVLPFYEDWENPLTLSLWTVKDDNLDGNTWEWRTTRGYTYPSTICYTTKLGEQIEANDWLFTPGIAFEKGATYRLKFYGKTNIYTYENLYVTIGKAASVAAHKNNIIREWTEFTTGGDFRSFSTTFTVDASSTYNLGFYINTNGGNNFYIDDMLIEKVLDKDMRTVALSSKNTAPTVNNAVTTVVSVNNNGKVNASGFTVQLLDADNQVLASSKVTRPLSAGSSLDVSLDFTPTKVGNMDVRGQVVYDEDETNLNNTTAPFTFSVQAANVSVSTIGTDKVLSQYMPFSPYGYSFTESVYLAKDMKGYIGDIESIAYKIQSGAQDLKNKPFKIWMGEVVDTMSLNAGWIPSTNLQLVYDNKFDIPTGTYDLKIPLDHPYLYKGGNLVILMDSQSEFGQTAEYGLTFFTTNYNENATMTMNGYYFDNSPETPDNLVGQFSSYIPNTMFFVNTAKTGKLSGYVYKTDGTTPLADVKLTVNGMNSSVKTDSKGYYEFSYVTSGSRNVSASLLGYTINQQTVNISDGTSSTQNFILSDLPKVTVTGKVVGGDNESVGLRGVKVSLSKYSSYEVTTDAFGNFTIPDVWGLQKYGLSASYDGYESYSAEFTSKSVNTDLGTIVLNEQPNQPLVVTAVDKIENASVTWEKPVAPQWITKDDGLNAGYFGSNTSGTYSVAHRYTPADLKALGIGDKLYVTKVKFYPASIASYTIKIWSGDTGSEVEIYSENVTPDIDQWFVQTLSTPVKIDPSKNLLIGYQVSQNPSAHPVGFDKGPAVENGDVFFDGSVWTTAREITSGVMNYNWNIQGFCSANPNSEPVQLTLNQVANSVKADNKTTDKALSSKMDSQRLAMGEDSVVSSVVEGGKYSVKLLESVGSAPVNTKSLLAEKEPLGYSVWRLKNGEEHDESNWESLTPSALTDTFFVDNTWKPLANGIYRYAVKANYSNSTSSPATFSNGIDKGKYAVVKVSVSTNAQVSAEGAKVTLKNALGEYSATVESDGYATVENVYFGTYSIVIQKTDFNEFESSNIVIDANNIEIGPFELKENTRPPKNAKASDYITNTVINWETPGIDKAKWIHKDSGANNGSIGYNSGGTMIIGQRFTSDELKQQELIGFTIDKIKIFPYASGEYTLKVWRGTKGAELEIYAQNVTINTEKQWVETSLSNPVEIVDNQSYIIGYEVAHAQGVYPCGYDFGPNVSGGDMIKVDNLWYSFYDATAQQYNFNWNIQTYCTNFGNSTKSVRIEKAGSQEESPVNEFEKSLPKVDASIFGSVTSGLKKSVPVQNEVEADKTITYKVWRLASEDKSNAANWTLLTPSNISDTTFTDASWSGIDNKTYYYAISAKYTAENYSDTVFTNALEKGSVSIVTIKAGTNNNSTSEGAKVKLKSTTNSYEAILGADESVTISEVKKGSYALTIEKDGYESFSANVDVNTDFTTLNSYELKEAKIAPAKVTVSSINENSATKIKWNSPGSYIPKEGWIYWDNGTPLTGLGNSKGSVVFDAAHAYSVSDINDLKIKGLSVTKVSFYVNNAPDLASTVAEYTVKIWKGSTPVLAYSQPVETLDLNAWNEIELNTPFYISGEEPIYIGYNCNLTAGYPAAIDKGPAVNNKGNLICDNDVWTNLIDLTGYDCNWLIHAYCADVANGNTKVVALPAKDISSVQNKGELSLKEGGLTKTVNTVSHKKINATDERLYTGYKLWRFSTEDKNDEAKWTYITETPTTDTVYTDNTWQGIALGTYEYAVKAVYFSGNSDATFSGIISSDGSGIDYTDANNAVVIYPNPNNGQFSIRTESKASAQIFNVLGKLVYSGILESGVNNIILDAPSGTYFIKVKSDRGESTFKILIQ